MSEAPADPKEPTADECTRRVVVFENDRFYRYATWYPQMGGYVAKCVVELLKDGDGTIDVEGCFEAYVWHDGEWPFSEADSGRSPARIHHCMAEQFVRFGREVLSGGKGEE